jgi:mRNA interferase MazF
VVIQQGEIWWAEAEDKRRPVLVVTRSVAIARLNRVTAVPITRTIRGIPTEVRLGSRHGLSEECVATFDAIQPIRTAFLTERVGALGPADAGELCRALRAMADC